MKFRCISCGSECNEIKYNKDGIIYFVCNCIKMEVVKHAKLHPNKKYMQGTIDANHEDWDAFR